jgi:hypothetical protein
LAEELILENASDIEVGFSCPRRAGLCYEGEARSRIAIVTFCTDVLTSAVHLAGHLDSYLGKWRSEASVWRLRPTSPKKLTTVDGPPPGPNSVHTGKFQVRSGCDHRAD